MPLDDQFVCGNNGLKGLISSIPRLPISVLNIYPSLAEGLSGTKRRDGFKAGSRQIEGRH